MLYARARFRVAAGFVVALLAGLAVVPPAAAIQGGGAPESLAGASPLAATVASTVPGPTLAIGSVPATYTPGLQFSVQATTTVAASTSYPLYVVDITTGTVLKTCTSYTYCTATVKLTETKVHQYVARQAASESPAVSTSPINLVLKLSASRDLLTVGSTFSLSVDSNFDLDNVAATWFVRIVDAVTGSVVGSCTSSDALSGMYRCSVAQPYFYGKGRTYRAELVALGDQAAVLAASNEVVVTSTPYVVSLSTAHTEALPGQSVDVTVHSNMQISAGATPFRVDVVDISDGHVVKSCTTLITYAANDYRCAVPVVVPTTPGQSRYQAVVNWLTAAGAAEVGRSNTIDIESKPWTVRLETSAAYVATGGSYTLTAFANADVRTSSTGNVLEVVDVGTGSVILSCGSTYMSATTSGEFSCSKSVAWDPQFASHTYEAKIRKVAPGTEGNLATSNAVTVEPKPWQFAVEVTGNGSMYDGWDLSFTANQRVGVTNGAYEIFIEDLGAGGTGEGSLLVGTGDDYTLPAGQLLPPEGLRRRCSTDDYYGGPMACKAHVYFAEMEPGATYYVRAYVARADDPLGTPIASSAPVAVHRTARALRFEVSSYTFSSSQCKDEYDSEHRWGAEMLAPYTPYRTGGRESYRRVLEEGGFGKSFMEISDTWDYFDEAPVSGFCNEVKAFRLTLEGFYTSPRTGRTTGNPVVAQSRSVIVPGAIWWYENIGGGNRAQYCANVCAGDPVNTSNGDFFAEDADLVLPGFGPPVSIARTYSSLGAGDNNGSGYGWFPNSGMRIEPLDGQPLDTSQVLAVAQENGSRSLFFRGIDGLLTPLERTMATLAQGSDGAYTFTRKDHLGFKFDREGRLNSVTDRNANTVSFERDSAGVLTRISAPDGRWIALEHNGAGDISRATDSTGRSVDYGYDAQRDLVSVVKSTGEVSTYGYDGAHHLTSFDLPGQSTAHNTYDAHGRVLTQTAPDGGSYAFTYAKNWTTYTNPDGSVTSETYTGGLISQRTVAYGTPLAATTKFSYTSAGQPASTTDPMGRVTQFVYDAQGNMRQVLDSAGGVRTTEYNADGDPTSIASGLGRAVSMHYDDRGNLVELVNALDETTTFAVGSRGEVLSATAPDGGTSTFTYDAVGNQTEAMSPEGVATKSEADSLGRPLASYDSRAWINGNVPNDYKTSYGYDALGRLVSITDPLGYSMSYAYDTEGRLDQKSDSTGGSVAYAYDAAGRVLSTTDQLGHATHYEYDSMGRRVATVTPTGARYTSAFNLRGDLTSTSDPLGDTTTYTYNVASQLLSATDPDGRKVTYTYDSRGRNTAIADALGNTTAYTYDVLGRLTQQIDPVGRETNYEYDILDRPDRVLYADGSQATTIYDNVGRVSNSTDMSGRVTSYSYDLDGRLTDYTNAVGLSVANSYDDAGYLMSSARSDGKTTGLSYDVLGRPAATTINGVAVSQTTYDEAGRVSTIVEPSGSTAYEYDAMGRVTSVDGATGAVGYSYDANGWLDTVTYPSGRTVSRDYDAAGRLVGVDASGVGSWTMDVSAGGLLESVAAPNGVVSSYGYDGAGRATSIDVASAGSSVVDLTYSYDAASQLVGRSTSWGGDVATPEVFGFDTLGRVSSVDSASSNVAYAPSSEVLALPSGVSLTLGADGAALTQTSAEGTTSYTYGADGSRVSEASDAGTRTYGWNDLGQLTSVADTATGADVSYTYAMGLRTRATVTTGSNTDTANYVWDTAAGVPRLLADGEFEYIYGAGSVPIAQVETATGDVTYLHGDLVGSTRAVTDASGALVASYDYSLYGEVSARTGDAQATRFLFAGEYLDPAGDYYLRNRVYDPESAQFLSVDPAVSSTGMPYAYTPGNPLQMVDPLGLYAGSAQLGADCTPDVSLWDTMKDGFVAEIKSPAFWGSLAAGAACMLVSGGTAVVACGALAGAVHSAMAFEALPEEEQTLSKYLWSTAADVGLGMLGGVGVGPARTSAVRAAEGVLATSGRAAEGEFFAAARTGVARLEQGAANSGADAMAGVRAAGQAGEDAAGILKNTQRIPSATGTAAYRIPDELGNGVLGEVKNYGGQLSYTSQLQDFAAYAQANGLQFNLYVRGSTTFSGPLQEAIDAGVINRVPSLGP